MKSTRGRWRLLLTPPASGAWNMAVDEAILEGVGKGQSLPYLRLYAWEPPCLSLGYAQACSDVDRRRLSSLGWDWVRRPTGGRAILHTDELTYSVIGPQSDPRLAGSVLESYQHLSKALLAALHSLDIPAASKPLGPAGELPENGPVCFEVPSNYEIVVDGKKLVGSAQARRKEGVLQHGTFPLWGDLTRITEVLAYADDSGRQEAKSRLLAHATTAEILLGRRIRWEDAAQAFIHGFQEELELEFIRDELSAAEMRRAEQLVQEKYTHPSWMERM